MLSFIGLFTVPATRPATPPTAAREPLAATRPALPIRDEAPPIEPTEDIAGATPPAILPAAVRVAEAVPVTGLVIDDATRDRAPGAAAVVAETVEKVR